MVVERNYMVFDLPTDLTAATSRARDLTQRQDSRFPVEVNLTACVTGGDGSPIISQLHSED